MTGGANVRISDLPPASVPLTGTELVELTQDGVSRSSTTADLFTGLGLDASFVTITPNTGLANERVLTADPGISLTDNGPGTTVVIGLTGVILEPTTLYDPSSNEAVEAMGSGFVSLKSVGNTDTEDRMLVLSHQNGIPRGLFGHQLGPNLSVGNAIPGGTVEVLATDLGSIGRTMISADPDTGVFLAYQGVDTARTILASGGGLEINNTLTGIGFERALTVSDLSSASQLVDGAANVAVIAEGTGLVGIRSTGNTDSGVRRIQLEHQDGTVRGSLGQTTSNLILENNINGADVRLRFTTLGGSPYTFLNADPDSIVSLGVPSGGSVRLIDLDTGNPLLIGIPTLGVSLYENAVRKFATRTNGVEVFGASNSPGDGGLVVFSTLSGTPQGYIGHNSSIALAVENQIHGGLVVLSAENAVGSLTNIFVGSPDGPTATYYTGLARLTTDASGVVTVLSDGNTDAEGRRIIFAHANGTERGMLGYTSVGDLFLINRIHGSPVRIQAEDAGGTAREILNADPDANTILYAAGIATVTLSSTGVTVSTGQIITPSGSAVAPAYAFVSDPDMGIYRSGPGVMAFSIGGTNRLNFNSTGFRLLGPPIYITEQAAANADSPGLGQLWVKNTTPCELWFTSDTGVDTKLA